MHRKKVVRISPNSKESAYNVGDPGLIMGREDSSGRGSANLLQYSHLGNSMDKEAWQATVYGTAKELDMTEQLNTHTQCSYSI